MKCKKLFEKIFNWELWNFYVLYAPLSPIWLWYCIKSGAVWFFTPSNPKITFGGFEGEGKKEMYKLLPPQLVPRTTYIKPHVSFEEVLSEIRATGLSYPFIVKPDVGMKGVLFRIIENEMQLKRYHERVPVEYIAQEKVDFPVEVSVFYYRYPWKNKGLVSGFIHKELLQVCGDGQRTLKQLILDNPRAKYRMAEMRSRHGHRFDRIIPAGEVFYLSFAGNHNRGAKFTNLHHLIDDNLIQVFDKISLNTDFYYGRYDIKTQSIEDLKAERNFTILEYNGAGAEPNHIYDCDMSLWQAYKTILHHWKVLYQISKYNALHGHTYWSYWEGQRFLRAAKKHFKLLKKYE